MIRHFVAKKKKVLLMILLLLLNIIIRIPSIPHEKGYDSFSIHSLANSVSIFGKAQWWINWQSVFGLYPYSYASAVPFTLSGITQTTGIEMEKTILLYCVTTGLLSVFIAYIFAGRIYKEFTFKYLMTLFFSLASGVMLFTTWEVSARGLFIVLFPLYMYILMKDNIHLKKLLLLPLLFIFIFATHHYAYFLIPPTVMYVVFGKIKTMKLPRFKETHIKYIIIGTILVLFLVPFFNRSLISSGSRYEWIIDAIKTNVRYIGPEVFFLFGGLAYLINKKKDFEEYFILSVSLIYIPMFYSHNYGPFLLLLPMVILASIGINNLSNLWISKNKKYLTIYILIIILIFVSFSTYYNHYRTGGTQSHWYMSADTSSAGIWARNNLPENCRGLDSGTMESARFFAVSEGHPIIPTIEPNNLAYGLVDITNITMVRNSPYSTGYYFEGPYVVKEGSTYSGKIEWLRLAATKYNQLKNFEYYIEDKYSNKRISEIVHTGASKIFDSERFAIWEI